MEHLQNSYMSIEQMQGMYFGNVKQHLENTNHNGLSFQELFAQASNSREQVSGVTFSKHANERLESRNIHLNDEQMERLNKGIEKAKEKSINESLVMMDNLAFIVNIRNNKVITAMDQESNDNNVFTNIDGAVIV